MIANKKTAPDRGEIEELLPWHAAGTLSRRDAARVEAAIAADPTLARNLEIVRDELHGAINLNESLGAPSARAVQKLFAAIDAEPARGTTPRLAHAIAARVAGFFAGFAPRTLAWSAAAAAVVILAQAAVLTSVYVGEPRYQAASAPHVAGAVRGTNDVLVRFVSDAGASAITKFLDQFDASIVEGPMSGGIYRLRIAPKGQTKDDIARQVARMQEERAIVSFAGPAM
ncbi:MAG: hypothetical protein HY056_00105 [Proteobacteria bacterium]|nr:hypothetical protein [Pseudomonadota bacterium]